MTDRLLTDKDDTEMKKPICQETRVVDSEPCKNPAKFVVDAPAYEKGQFLVCGIHARIFGSTFLHPFRLEEWIKKTKEGEIPK